MNFKMFVVQRIGNNANEGHYQAMLCPGDLMPFTRVRVPVDDQTGEFEAAQLTGACYWRIMLRVG